MSQYHFLDESGDLGLSGIGSSSRHFVIAMVQLSENINRPELSAVRHSLHLPETFEFKFNTSRPHQKEAFFQAMQQIPYRVRAVVLDKSRPSAQFRGVGGQQLMVELVTSLVLRASVLDIANDVLILDGAVPSLIRALRIRFSAESRSLRRIRPFRKIESGDSGREDGVQMADMIAGAIRHEVLGHEHYYYQTFSNKIVDFWT